MDIAFLVPGSIGDLVAVPVERITFDRSSALAGSVGDLVAVGMQTVLFDNVCSVPRQCGNSHHGQDECNQEWEPWFHGSILWRVGYGVNVLVGVRFLSHCNYGYL